MPNTTSRITASSAVDRSRNVFIREKIEGTPKRLHKDHMKTVTVTEAKKNLSRWLAAAAQGEDVGIVFRAILRESRRDQSVAPKRQFSLKD
jgi:hypothetical protein